MEVHDMASIKDFNLITDGEARRLYDIGIRTYSQLLERASTAFDRMTLADTAHVDNDTIENLTHHSDMMRIRGMTPALAKELCKSGTYTVPKLAYQTASGLFDKLTRNNFHEISKHELEKIIAQAKTLPKIIRH